MMDPNNQPHRSKQSLWIGIILVVGVALGAGGIMLFGPKLFSLFHGSPEQIGSLPPGGKPPPPPPPEPLTLAAEAQKNSDLSFLVGDWISDELRDQSRQQGFVLKLHFASGKEGTSEIYINQEKLCAGKVVAQYLDDKRVSMRDVDFPVCADRTSFDKMVIICEGTNPTLCRAGYPSQEMFPIRFVREKTRLEQPEKVTK